MNNIKLSSTKMGKKEKNINSKRFKEDFVQPNIKRTFLNHESFPQHNTDKFKNLDEYINDGDENTRKPATTTSGKLSDYLIEDARSHPSSDFESINEQLKYELDRCFNSLPPNHRVPTLSKNPAKTTTKKKSSDATSGNPYLSAEEAIKFVNERKFNLVSIDNEFFERSPSKVTEIGVSIYNPKYQQFALFPHFLHFHFIVKEFINLRNGVYVPDSKMSNITGQSIIISLKDVPYAMSTIFDFLGPETFIVGHNVSGDVKSFQYLNYKIPVTIPIIDTTTLWYSLIGSKNAKSSLHYILDKLNVPHAYLHNGANDAYYTLIVCLMLTSPELRNNMIFHKKKPKTSEEETCENSEKVEDPVLKPQMPDFSEFSPEVAKTKMDRWLRKQTKATEKAKKKKLQARVDTDVSSQKIRCAIDDDSILRKHKGPNIRGQNKPLNPPANVFFKPRNFEKDILIDKLEELNV